MPARLCFTECKPQRISLKTPAAGRFPEDLWSTLFEVPDLWIFAANHQVNCCKVAIELGDPKRGEGKAHTCADGWFRQLTHSNLSPCSWPRFSSRQPFDLARRIESSIPESWRTLWRSVAKAALIGVCFTASPERPGVCISSRALLMRWLLLVFIARKANACASGTPSTPPYRNLMCAFTLPKTVPKTISPSVPSGIGPFTSRAVPPVNESRWSTPMSFWLSTVKIAFC